MRSLRGFRCWCPAPRRRRHSVSTNPKPPSQDQDYDDASLSAAGGQPAVVVDQGFRDGSRSEVFGRVGYELSSLTSVFVETSYNEHDYTGTLFDSDGYKVMGGLRYQFSALTQGDFAVGYMHQNLGAYTTQSALDTYTYRGTLSYALTPLITLRLIAARDFGGPSHFAGASTRVNSDVGITADYAIRRDLTLSAGYGYNLTDYIGTGRTDNRHKLSLGAQYYLNRYASLFAKYDHTHFDAGRVLPDEVSTDYAKDVVLAGIRLRY